MNQEYVKHSKEWEEAQCRLAQKRRNNQENEVIKAGEYIAGELYDHSRSHCTQSLKIDTKNGTVQLSQKQPETFKIEKNQIFLLKEFLTEAHIRTDKEREKDDVFECDVNVF